MSKLNYRLYELESLCLSYEASPFDSLLALKEGIFWLKNAQVPLFETERLQPLFASCQQFILSLQHKHSPFLPLYRELFLELFDLIRQLSLENEFYSGEDAILSSRKNAVLALQSEMDRVSAELIGSEQALNYYEAILSFDENAWVTRLMSFLEGFAKEGCYQVDAGFGTPYMRLLRNKGLKVSVASVQSLAWLQAHHSQFEWQLVEHPGNRSSDMNLLFNGLKEAYALMPNQAQKQFDYQASYQVLSRLYKKENVIPLSELASHLKSLCAIEVRCFASQEQFLFPLNSLDDFCIALMAFKNETSDLSHDENILYLQDVAGKTYIALGQRELGLRSPLLKMELALDPLQYDVYQMQYENQFLCLPAYKFHSSHAWQPDFPSIEGMSRIQIEIKGLGFIDVYLGDDSIDIPESEKRLLVINELDMTYGVLVSQFSKKIKACRQVSYGVNNRINMLWLDERGSCTAEANFVSEVASGAPESAKLDSSPLDLAMLSSAWLAQFEGVQCIITPDLVEKHFPMVKPDEVYAFYHNQPMIKLEGQVFPFIDLAQGKGSSIVLLSHQGIKLCISLSSIYYEKNIQNFLSLDRQVTHCNLKNYQNIKKAKNSIYLIDNKSFN